MGILSEGGGIAAVPKSTYGGNNQNVQVPTSNVPKISVPKSTVSSGAFSGSTSSASSSQKADMAAAVADMMGNGGFGHSGGISSVMGGNAPSPATTRPLTSFPSNLVSGGSNRGNNYDASMSLATGTDYNRSDPAPLPSYQSAAQTPLQDLKAKLSPTVADQASSLMGLMRSLKAAPMSGLRPNGYNTTPAPARIVDGYRNIPGAGNPDTVYPAAPQPIGTGYTQIPGDANNPPQAMGMPGRFNDGSRSFAYQAGDAPSSWDALVRYAQNATGMNPTAQLHPAVPKAITPYTVGGNTAGYDTSPAPPTVAQPRGMPGRISAPARDSLIPVPGSSSDPGWWGQTQNFFRAIEGAAKNNMMDPAVNPILATIDTAKNALGGQYGNLGDAARGWWEADRNRNNQSGTDAGNARFLNPWAFDVASAFAGAALGGGPAREAIEALVAQGVERSAAAQAVKAMSAPITKGEMLGLPSRMAVPQRDLTDALNPMNFISAPPGVNPSILRPSSAAQNIALERGYAGGIAGIDRGAGYFDASASRAYPTTGNVDPNILFPSDMARGTPMTPGEGIENLRAPEGYFDAATPANVPYDFSKIADPYAGGRSTHPYTGPTASAPYDAVARELAAPPTVDQIAAQKLPYDFNKIVDPYAGGRGTHPYTGPSSNDYNAIVSAPKLPRPSSSGRPLTEWGPSKQGTAEPLPYTNLLSQENGIARVADPAIGPSDLADVGQEGPVVNDKKSWDAFLGNKRETTPMPTVTPTDPLVDLHEALGSAPLKPSTVDTAAAKASKSNLKRNLVAAGVAGVGGPVVGLGGAAWLWNQMHPQAPVVPPAAAPAAPATSAATPKTVEQLPSEPTKRGVTTTVVRPPAATGDINELPAVAAANAGIAASQAAGSSGLDANGDNIPLTQEEIAASEAAKGPLTPADLPAGAPPGIAAALNNPDRSGQAFTLPDGTVVGRDGYIFQKTDNGYKRVGRVPGFTPAQLYDEASKGAFRDPNKIVVGPGTHSIMGPSVNEQGYYPTKPLPMSKNPDMSVLTGTNMLPAAAAKDRGLLGGLFGGSLDGLKGLFDKKAGDTGGTNMMDTLVHMFGNNGGGSKLNTDLYGGGGNAPGSFGNGGNGGSGGSGGSGSNSGGNTASPVVMPVVVPPAATNRNAVFPTMNPPSNPNGTNFSPYDPGVSNEWNYYPTPPAAPTPPPPAGTPATATTPQPTTRPPEGGLWYKAKPTTKAPKGFDWKQDASGWWHRSKVVKMSTGGVASNDPQAGGMDPKTSLIQTAKDALTGRMDPDQAQQVLTEFVQTFGPAALEQLKASLRGGQTMNNAMGRDQPRYVDAPGTGIDGVDAQIVGGGSPPQPAKINNGEVIMTADAVKGAGNGDPQRGAAQLMQLDKTLRSRSA